MDALQELKIDESRRRVTFACGSQRCFCGIGDKKKMHIFHSGSQLARCKRRNGKI